MPDLENSDAFGNAIDDYLDWLRVERGLSANTLTAYQRDLLSFQDFVGTETAPGQVEETGIRAYLAARAEHGVTARTQTREMVTLRGFFRYLVSEEVIDQNPTLRIDLPKTGRPLPKTITLDEVERLLVAPDVDTPMGLRDRTMFEILYATGLRVTELVALQIEQLHLEMGYVRIIGKGDKERVVPLGEVARKWLETYLMEARDILTRGDRTRSAGAPVFVSRLRRAMSRQSFF